MISNLSKKEEESKVLRGEGIHNKTGVYVSLDVVYFNITKYPKTIDLTRSYRNGDKSAKSKMLWFAVGKYRNNKLLTENFISADKIVIEFDDVPDVEYLRSQLKDSEIYKHIRLMYTSPSGNGLRLLFMLDGIITEPEHYRQTVRVYSALLKKILKINYGKLDISASIKPAGFWFISHDKYCYLEPAAKPLPIPAYIPPTRPNLTPDERSVVPDTNLLYALEVINTAIKKNMKFLLREQPIF